jgi:4-oxalocrotonate tautomerase
MPIITAHILAGRDTEKKRAFIRALTQAAVDTLDAPVESVRVILSEMDPEHFGIAGSSVAERRASSS